MCGRVCWLQERWYKKALGGRVGNRVNIMVESDKWLSHKPVFKGDVQPSLRVAELIDKHSWQWDRNKVAGMFATKTCDEIMAIPLSRDRQRDTLIWKENRKHEFSVKSAYRVALRLKQGVEAEHSRAGEEGKPWKMIWDLKVPPKIRNFMWRAVSNILPTRDNLYWRRVAMESTCEFHRQHPETEAHVLWECLFARNVWALAKGIVQKCSNNAQDFFQLFKLKQEKLSREELEQWCTTT